jgi:hypothetical protein
LISLRDAGIDGEPGAFCNVGRTAEVRFERHDLGALRGMVQSVGVQLLSLLASATPNATLVAPADTPYPAL